MKIKHRKLLSKEGIGRLVRGKFYGVYAEPGSGKTHMMKTAFIKYCEQHKKRILILTHRDSLKRQTKADLEEDIKKWEEDFRGGGIVIINYQAIEAAYIYDLFYKVEPLLEMDFIICDEAHYMVKDSWNEQTDYTAQFLEDAKGVKVLMTGTPKEINVLNQLWDVERLTEVNRENNNLVAIRVYEKNSDLIQHINEYANENVKVLSFISGKTEKVLDLKIKNGGAFVVSKHNELYHEADHELMEIVIQGENIKTNGILPTYKVWSTSVWNEGVNLLDANIKAVCSFQPRSSTEFIQQFARPRRSDIIGCIVAPTRKMLVGQKQKCEDNLAEIYAIRSENSNPKFAKMSELYFLESIRETVEILEQGFGAYVASIYQTIPVQNYGQVVRDQKIGEYLETVVDVKMFEQEQEQFKEIMFDTFGYRDSNRKKNLGLKSFNKFLQDGGIEYELVSKRESSRKSESFSKTYWKVLRNMTQLLYIGKASKCVAPTECKEPDFEKQINAFTFNNERTENDGMALLINAVNQNKSNSKELQPWEK